MKKANVDINQYIPEIDFDDYDYYLPKEKIASFPLKDRGKSRILVARRDNQFISHHFFDELPDLINKDTLIVWNNTKVIPARIKVKKESGGKAEILCVEPLEPATDPVYAMQAKGKCKWNCIVGGKRIHSEDKLYLEYQLADLKLSIIVREKIGNNAVIEFFYDENKMFSDILELAGSVPLPPYIKREPLNVDKDNYQTVYARWEGSVAAPTAGLHFTPDIIDKLSKNGADFIDIILHVGPGTFKPVDNNDIINHKMHGEQIFVSKNSIQKIYKKLLNNKQTATSKKNILAVGTTTVRTLETLYWLGLKMKSGILPERQNDCFTLGQWEPYMLMKIYKEIPEEESYLALLNYLENEKLDRISCITHLIIIPGYKFKIADSIITNYHLPKSTLILLVAAFTGRDFWNKIYESALINNYRFLSYGDCSLLI